MNPRTLQRAALAALAAVSMGGAFAQSGTAPQTREELRERDGIYGSELMRPQERNAYRNRLRELKTEQGREQFRKEHHERMSRGGCRAAARPQAPGAAADDGCAGGRVARRRGV